MIEQLTDDQKARCAEFRDKWMEIGLSTAPADRPMAEEGIRMAYAAGGLPPPARIVWCGSPLSQGLTRAIVMNNTLRTSIKRFIGTAVSTAVWDSVVQAVHTALVDSVRYTVRGSGSVQDLVMDSIRTEIRSAIQASVMQSVADAVRYPVRGSVQDLLVFESIRVSVLNAVKVAVVAWGPGPKSVHGSVRASAWTDAWSAVGVKVSTTVWERVRSAVHVSTRNSVLDSIQDSIGAAVPAEVRTSVLESVQESAYGQHDAYWLGFYDYFREVCGLVAETDRLQGLMQCAKSAGWFLPHRQICWVSERHHILQRDDRERLHNVRGPALAYPDGWSIYAVHGILVPAHIIEHQEAITAESIDAESNAEVRRVMLELYGLDRYLLTGESLDAWEDYRLLQKKHGERNLLALVMRCPTTGAVYVHPVHPDVRTVEQALRWKRGHDDFQSFTNEEFYRHGDVYIVRDSEPHKDYRAGLIWEK